MVIQWGGHSTRRVSCKGIAYRIRPGAEGVCRELHASMFAGLRSSVNKLLIVSAPVARLKSVTCCVAFAIGFLDPPCSECPDG